MLCNGTLWIDDVQIREVQVLPTRRTVPVDALIAALEPVTRSADDSAAILFAPPTKKILRQMSPDDGALRAGTAARVALARNEHEGVQVVLAAVSGDLDNVNVSIASPPVQDLQIVWHPVGYVGLCDGERLLGESWPDIMLPPTPFNVAKGDLQPIWIDVHAGENTPAGDYRVQITIDPIGVTTTIDVHVYNFAIPRRSTLPTFFHANRQGTRDQLASHRLMAGRLAARLKAFHNHAVGSPREFDEVRPIIERELAAYRDAGGTMFAMDMPYFRGCFAGGTHSAGAHGEYNLVYNDEHAAYITRYHRDFADFARDKGIIDKTYIYLWDEPHSKIYPNMRTIRELIRRADPDILCMMAGDMSLEIADVIDIWVPVTKHWNENQELAAKLKQNGDRIWRYVCGAPQAPYPNFAHTDPTQDLLASRLLFWMVY